MCVSVAKYLGLENWARVWMYSLHSSEDCQVHDQGTGRFGHLGRAALSFQEGTVLVNLRRAVLHEHRQRDRLYENFNLRREDPRKPNHLLINLCCIGSKSKSWKRHIYAVTPPLWGFNGASLVLKTKACGKCLTIHFCRYKEFPNTGYLWKGGYCILSSGTWNSNT